MAKEGRGRPTGGPTTSEALHINQLAAACRWACDAASAPVSRFLPSDLITSTTALHDWTAEAASTGEGHS